MSSRPSGLVGSKSGNHFHYPTPLREKQQLMLPRKCIYEGSPRLCLALATICDTRPESRVARTRVPLAWIILPPKVSRQVVPPVPAHPEVTRSCLNPICAGNNTFEGFSQNPRRHHVNKPEAPVVPQRKALFSDPSVFEEVMSRRP